MWEGSHKRHWVSDIVCPYSTPHEIRFRGLEQCWESPGWKCPYLQIHIKKSKQMSRPLPQIPQLCLESPLPGCDSILAKCICNNPMDSFHRLMPLGNFRVLLSLKIASAPPPLSGDHWVPRALLSSVHTPHCWIPATVSQSVLGNQHQNKQWLCFSIFPTRVWNGSILDSHPELSDFSFGALSTLREKLQHRAS